jgi:two-component system, cell cycle sensor histidine kinase and response regulator CckA
MGEFRKIDKVLVIEDEPAVRKVVSDILLCLGFQVTLARSGEEAIDKYVDEIKRFGYPFDVVIMDLSIHSGMSGRECVDVLRKIDPDVKILITAGYIDDPVLKHYRDYGFEGVLQKPFEIESLSRQLLRMTH